MVMRRYKYREKRICEDIQDNIYGSQSLIFSEPVRFRRQKNPAVSKRRDKIEDLNGGGSEGENSSSNYSVT